jgi:amino acid permease
MKFLHATAVLIGIMVGVGFFGIPFAFAKAGFWVGAAWLVALAVIVCVFDLLFAELTVSTSGTHQVVGYAGIWLGPWGRRIITLANVLSLYGALLAYLIVAGEFLHNVLSNFLTIDPQWYALVFGFALSLLWFLRARTMASLELVLIGIYVAVICVIVVIGVPHIAWSNFIGWTPDFWYLPYGIILFSLAGLSAIPIQRQLLAGRERLMRPAIITAIAVVVALYLLFAFVVVGISGDVTSPEALSGLYGIIGAPIIIFGSLLGVFTISTSYTLLGTALYETFNTDYKIPPFGAWLLSIVPPIFFFMSGLRNFIDVIGLIGAVAVGAISVLLLIAYQRACRRNKILVWALMAFFVAGIVYQFIAR